MIGKPEQDAFVSSQKWAVITTLRQDGSPSNSVVFFYRDGDELVFSITKERLKYRTLVADPRIAVTVLDEGAPYRFVTVEGTASIQDTDVVGGHVALNRHMRGDAAWSPPEGYAERLANDKRVLVRVAAERVSGVVNRG